MPCQLVRFSEVYACAVDAYDPDGDALVYGLTTGPAGMTIDAQGRVPWRPSVIASGINS